MFGAFKLAPNQPGSLYQSDGSSTAYKLIKLIAPDGSEVTVRVEAMPWAVDTAFAYVTEKLVG